MSPNGQRHGALGDHLFQRYKSQLPVVEPALEITALMLGTDKSRGYCLEMICADFLADAALERETSEHDIECLTFDGNSRRSPRANGFDKDKAE